MNRLILKSICASAILVVTGGITQTLQAQRTASPFHVEKDLVYSTADDLELRLDAYLPKDDGKLRPGVLVVHGGAWRRGDKSQLSLYAGALAKRGYAAFAIDYRLAPAFKFPAQLDDCRAAVRWMRKNARKYNVDTGHIGAVGYSAGGHLVTLLACTSHEKRYKETAVHAVVAGGAPCDFRETPERRRTLSYWLGGTRGEIPQVYTAASPAAFVTAAAPPMFFFHGEKDRLVNPDSPRKMVDALKKAKVEASLHIVPAGGHFGAALDRDALRKAWQFFDTQLKKPARATRLGGA